MYLHRWFSAAFFFLLFAISIAATSNTPAFAREYFVSKNGNNADGLSWASAWNELDQIQWSQLRTADVINIDGGVSQMTYSTPLQARLVDTHYRISIRAGYIPQHNGQVVIDGHGAPSAGISMIAGSTNITAKARSGIVVTHWLDGVYIDSQNEWEANQIRRLEVYGNRRNGVHVHGIGGNIFQCIIHDNGSPTGAGDLTANVLFSASSQAAQNGITNSWVYNSIQNYADGIVDRGSTLTSTNNVGQSVIGPGLRDAYRQETGMANIGNCLLLNASRDSLVMGKGTGGVEAVTVVLTKKNAAGMSHTCFSSGAQANPNHLFYVAYSIFFRGLVKAPVIQNPQVPGNKQFQVTGNTMLLAPNMEDPQFAQQSIYEFPDNVPLQTLIDSDYSIARTRPGGVPPYGSRVTSVAQLLRDYMQSDP